MLLHCRYGGDQDWLAETVMPLVKNHTLLHASWYCKQHGAAEWRGFPTQRINNRDFVGNVYSAGSSFQGLEAKRVCPVECRRRKEWDEC